MRRTRTGFSFPLVAGRRHGRKGGRRRLGKDLRVQQGHQRDAFIAWLTRLRAQSRPGPIVEEPHRLL